MIACAGSAPRKRCSPSTTGTTLRFCLIANEAASSRSRSGGTEGGRWRIRPSIDVSRGAARTAASGTDPTSLCSSSTTNTESTLSNLRPGRLAMTSPAVLAGFAVGTAEVR
jgi:hypothetical protein